MKNGFILVHELLHDLARIRGRIVQVESKITKDGKGHHFAAVAELTSVRSDMSGLMDKLVEVQALFPDPSKGDIIRHYNPEAVDVPAVAVDPVDLMGMIGTTPGPGKSESLPTAEEAVATIKYIIDGPPVPEPEVLVGMYNLLADRQVEAAMQLDEEVPIAHYGDDITVNDLRPAGWTEALALEFIAHKLNDEECGPFAIDFVEGDWGRIQRQYPEFQTWINKQLEGGYEHDDE